MGSESKYLSLGTITGSDAIAKTITESTWSNQRTSNSATASSFDKRWIKHEGLRQLAHVAAKNGVWIENYLNDILVKITNNKRLNRFHF